MAAPFSTTTFGPLRWSRFSRWQAANAAGITAIDSNITDVRFFLPGTSTSAMAGAFGLIFTGVEVSGETRRILSQRPTTGRIIDAPQQVPFVVPVRCGIADGKGRVMKHNLLMGVWVAICVGFSGAAQGALVRFETSATSLHVGDTATVALHWDGRGGPSLWSWGVTIDFDPAVIQPGFVGWGSRDLGSQGTGNQLACPGPTRATCTHVGGWIDIAYPQAGHLMMSEGSYAEPDTLDAFQADQFDLLWIDFMAVGEGSTPLAIHPDGYFLDAHFLSGPTGPFIAVTVTEGQLDVVPMPEPATLWLGLAGLAALAGAAARRRCSGG